MLRIKAKYAAHVRFASAFGKYKVLMGGVLIVMAKRVLMAVILIVEDNGFVRETAEMWIQDLGHHTLSANNVDEALSLLRSPQHIDALFTDIYLKPLFYGGCDLANQASRFGQNCVCFTRPAVPSTTK